MEFHVQDPILKYVVNGKIADLISELEKLKLMKDAYNPIKHESNTNLMKETVVNTSINPPTPHGRSGDEEPKNKKRTEADYKHYLFMWFWLALHLEKLEVLRELSLLDSMVNKICENLIK